MHLIFCAYSYHFRCFNLYYFFEDLHFLWVIYLYSQSASFNISYGAGLLEMETLATVCLKMSYFTFILSDFFLGITFWADFFLSFSTSPSTCYGGFYLLFNVNNVNFFEIFNQLNEFYHSFLYCAMQILSANIRTNIIVLSAN